jgi:hypothetical protein
MAYHVDPFHIVRIEFVHCIHVMLIPRFREPIHQPSHGCLIVGAERRRSSRLCRIRIPAS